jgi:hypothetical protein
MSRNILFISRNDIIRRSPLGGNVDPEKIIPFVKTAQDKYIWIILGSVLYFYLQDLIETDTVATKPAYADLLDYYIKDTIVHYSMVEAIPFMPYTMVNAGILKELNTVQSTVPDKREVDFLLQKELQTAQFYAERLVTHLIANVNIYPQYVATTGKSDNVFPDMGQQYTQGWVI